MIIYLTILLQLTMIDHKIASIILDELGFTLEDLSLKYGDMCIENGQISHQLYYASVYSSANIAAYIYHDNGIYYTSVGLNNFSTPQLAAIDMISESDCYYALNLFYARQLDLDYI